MYLLKACRPLQWIKNGVIFLPCIFAIDHIPRSLYLSLLDLICVSIAFCCMSSAVYLFNDLMDREIDSKHPLKKDRPIASGNLNPKIATIASTILMLGGIIGTAFIQPLLIIPSIIYLTVNIGYSLGIKRIVILDIFSVASGYLIRIVVGAWTIQVEPSEWLYVTTGVAALFIVIGRRYAEVRLTPSHKRREVLKGYTNDLVTQLMIISASAAFLSYTLYTVEKGMILTLPSVAFGLFRYVYLLNTNSRAESPEHLIVHDIPLIAGILSWIFISAIVIFTLR